MDKILEIDISFNHQIIKNLIDFCYESVRLDHVVHNGFKYYPRSCTWYDGPENRPKYDENIMCNGYDECDENCEATIFPKKDDKIDYVLKFKNNFSVETFLKMPNYESNEKSKFDKILKELISKSNSLDIGIENIYLTGYDSINLINKMGINDDHRGSNHCQLSLDFHESYELHHPIKLIDFYEALYRIKSHKWDNWYELYCGSSFKLNGNKLNIYTRFDHGS